MNSIFETSRVTQLVRVFALASLLFVGALPAQEPDAPEELRILFVGNSLTYTHDVPGILRELLEAKATGPVTVEALTGPNLGLEDHWRRRKVRKTLARGEWDVVIVQQGPSATEGRPSLLKYSQRFAREVETHGGDLAVYMVWPSRARFQDFDGVIESHRMAAEQAGARLFPVGDAWRTAWAADPLLALYGPDGFHPSPEAAYLAALVIFQQITGHTTIGLPTTLTTDGGVTLDVPPATAGRLQQAAAQTNRDYGLDAAAVAEECECF